MSRTSPYYLPQRHSLGAGIAALHSRARRIIAFGIILTALGLLAFSSVVTATIVSVYFVGASMIAAGILEIIIGMQARAWGGFFFWVALGLLYGVAGALALSDPLLAAGALTLLLGASLLTVGVLRIILAFQMQAGSAWSLVAFSGAVTTLLGGMILAQWPFSSLYILGVFLSVDLIFAGVGWLSLGLALSSRK